MKLAEAFARAAEKEVLIQVGALTLGFRIHRVTSADMLSAGGGFLFAAQPAAAPGPAADAEAQAMRAKLEDRVRKDPNGIFTFAHALACASVVAGSRDGGTTWEPLRLVMKEGQQNAAAGELYIGNLPLGVPERLMREIVALSTDGGAAGERLASFLGGAAASP